MRSFSKCLILLALISGCQPRNSKQTRLNSPSGFAVNLNTDETLRLRIGDEPSSWNWLLTGSDILTLNISEGLFEYEFDGQAPVLKPALVDTWRSEGMGKKWIFHLKSNVHWSNGDLFSASDVVNTFRWILNPENGGVCARQIFNFKNAKSIYEKKADSKSLGVKAVSATELIIELERPFLALPRVLTQTCLFPAHKLQLSSKPELVTLGPYRLSEWAHDRWLWLSANPTYYGAAPKIKNLVTYIIPEHATATDLFLSRGLDALNAIAPAQFKRLSQMEEHRSASVPLIYYLIFNTEVEPFNNKLVRQAFAQAIDREALAGIFQDGRIPLRSLIPKGFEGYNENAGLRYAPDDARNLIKEAKIDLQKLRPTIIFPTTENEKMIFEFLQDQFKKNLGVQTDLQGLEFKMFLAAKKQTGHPLIRGADLTDPISPISFLEGFSLAGSSLSASNWKSPTYLKLIDQAEFETDPKKQAKLVTQIQKLILEDEVVVVPFLQDQVHLLVHKNLKDYPVNHLHRLVYKWTSKVGS